ncbi:MAG TPA: hypothetical protein PKZ19_14785, partial [Zoogloea sp.]|nr:hypothetical protein [Zoogloea sp.]
MANQYRNYIDGEFVVTAEDPLIEVRNPANGELLAFVPDAGTATVERAVAAAPHDARTFDSLGVLRASAGQLAEAIAAVDAGLQRHPNELSLL